MLETEIAKTCNDNFVKSPISTSGCVDEHRLNFLNYFRPVFKNVIFTNKRFKSGFAMKVLNNAFNNIRGDLLSGWERKQNSCGSREI